MVVGALSFLSQFLTMKSIGLDPYSCPHKTTSQQDMAAPNPREILYVRQEESGREERGGLIVSSSLLSFSLWKEGSKVEGREEERVGVVHVARELSGPLISHLLQFPLFRSAKCANQLLGAHRYNSTGPLRRALSQTKGFNSLRLSARHCVIKPGTDQILSDPCTKETGREEGGGWGFL